MPNTRTHAAIPGVGQQDRPDAVDRLFAGIAAGKIADDVYAPDALVDATVPGWRFEVAGAPAILAEYGRWFAHPARFAEQRRLPTPGGAVVEYMIEWDEDGVAHAAHHAHLLTVVDDRITADTVFCGGRWAADLLAQMRAAAHAG